MTVTPLPLPSPLNNLLLVNWASAVTMLSSYQTQITPSRVDGAEERFSLIDRPARELLSSFSGLDRARATQMWMNLARAGDQRTVMPLYQDQVETTGATSDRFDAPLQANVTDIPCSTSLQRFFVGARIVLIQTNGEQIEKLEVGTLVTVAPSLLTVFDLASDFAAGSLVMPLLDVEIELKASGRFKTDKVFNVKVKSREVPGPSALDRSLTTIPPGPSYNGSPIFNLPVHWGRAIKSSISRAGKVVKQGKAKTAAVRETRPRFIHELLVADERSFLWPAIQFFDWAEGRREIFWLVAPNVTYAPVSVSTTQIAVTPIGLLNDHQDFLENIAIVQTDGTILIRGIASISEIAGEWRIVFDSSIPSIALSDISICTPAHLVRFQTDSYRERWNTTGFGEVKLSMVDVLSEEDVLIPSIDPPDSKQRSDIESLSDLYFWMDASGPAWFGTTPTLVAEVRSSPYRMLRQPTARYIPIDGVPNNLSEPKAWSKQSHEDVFFDVRQARDDNSLIEPYLTRAASTNSGGFNASQENHPELAFFARETFNNGLPTNYHFGIRHAITRRTLGWQLQNSNSIFWDAANGMTIFVMARFGGDAFSETDLFFVSRQGVFEWRNGVVRFFETVDISVPNHTITYTQPLDSSLYIMAVRWVPSSIADIYIDGGAAVASAPIAPASINPTARGTHILSFRPGPFGTGSGDPQDIDNNLERQHFSNALLMFKRGLSLAEMDTVGNYLALRYGATWEAAL